MQPGPSNYWQHPHQQQQQQNLAQAQAQAQAPYTPQPSQACLQAAFDDFESYPFSQDKDFNAGLPDVIAVIKEKRMPASAIDEMIARAQWFYFCRIRGLAIPWESYASYVRSDSPTPDVRRSPGGSPNANPRRGSKPSNPWTELNSLAEARRMLSPATGENDQSTKMSFEMLSRLIAEGRAGELRGREIPDQLNDATPSQSTQSQRPKPWQTQQQHPAPAPAPSQYGPSYPHPQTQTQSATLSYASYDQNPPPPPPHSSGYYPSYPYTAHPSQAQTLSAEYAPSPGFADPFTTPAGESGSASISASGAATPGMGGTQNYQGTSYSYEELEGMLGQNQNVHGQNPNSHEWYGGQS